MGATIIHCNRSLAHQRELAGQLRKGFAVHGINAEISFRADTQGDTHVVLGPHFAYPQWRHARTLMIDRAYWGDPDCVAIHWLEGGEKVFLRDMPKRDHPKLRRAKRGSRTLYLCDYGQRPDREYDSVRYHPAENRPQGTLQDALDTHDKAVGMRSTALVDAAIHGLKVETGDPHSPVYGLTNRKKWINDLAWHNWSRSEIENGDFLDGIGQPYATQ